MAGELNQIKWRGIRPTDPEEDIPVKQGTAANLKATVDVAAGQEIEVTQDTAADLKATVDVAAGQEIEVTQGTHADLKNTTLRSHIAQGQASSGIITNPAANTIYADTGQLNAGIYDLLFNTTGASNYAYFSFEHRNAANNANIAYWGIPVGAYKFNNMLWENWAIAQNERIRVRAASTGTGNFTATITYVRRS